jgi:hypothetical protein
MRVTVAKIPHTLRTRMVRASHDVRVDARLATGWVPETLRCSQSMPLPAEP